MKTTTLRHLAILGLISTALLHSTLGQTTAVTDPVGYVTMTLAGNADSYVYLPFKKNPDYAGATTGSVTSGNILTVANPPTSPPWAANQFGPATSGQPRYYVLFRSGSKAGMFYTITANTNNQITLDLAGDTISAAVPSGTTFQICAYETLGSLFPNGNGVHPSATHSLAARQTEVFVPDTSTPGVNLGPAGIFYYYSGTAGSGPGWRQAGNISTIVNDRVLYPDNYFIVRHNIATSTTLTHMGTVQIGQIQVPLTTLADNTSQDISLGIPVPANLNLTQTNLFQSGVFIGSTSHSLAARGDELFVWDNALSATKNKAPDLTYYYYTGTAGAGPGWRKSGDISNIANGDVVIGSGKAVAIRKKSSGAASTVFWTVTPTYAP